ncbi:hypothetical protein ACP3T3_08655 [Chryseobacterium sp. CBSDS_008]
MKLKEMQRKASFINIAYYSYYSPDSSGYPTACNGTALERGV